jgi:hypothetical protein
LTADHPCRYPGAVIGISSFGEAEREIDYGTGKEVIDESISDAKVPLRMTWYAGSYLDLPVYK